MIAFVQLVSGGHLFHLINSVASLYNSCLVLSYCIQANTTIFCCFIHVFLSFLFLHFCAAFFTPAKNQLEWNRFLHIENIIIYQKHSCEWCFTCIHLCPLNRTSWGLPTDLTNWIHFVYRWIIRNSINYREMAWKRLWINLVDILSDFILIGFDHWIRQKESQKQTKNFFILPEIKYS